MIISLGPSTDVHTQVRIHTKEVQLFGGLTPSLEQVMDVLTTKDITATLPKVGIQVDDVTMDNYVRIYDRIIRAIKGTKPVFFIRKSPLSKNNAKKFVAAVNNINQKCKFVLIVIDTEKEALANNVLRIKDSENCWDEVWDATTS